MGLRDLFIDFIYSFVKNKNYKNNNELIEFICLKFFDGNLYRYFLFNNYNYDFTFINYSKLKNKLYLVSAKSIEILKNRNKSNFDLIGEITDKSTNKEIVEFIIKIMIYNPNGLFNYFCIKEINNYNLKNEIKELP